MPERILALSNDVSALATTKVAEIQKATAATKILALNAQIEAARAGEHGKGFAVVAQEVKDISVLIARITDQLTQGVKEKTTELQNLGQGLIANVRGRRLADLALNMIEIIDRNLYERSCDVRWWATDSAVVDCVAAQGSEKTTYASKRLGVILNAYTVYLDLWIVDKHGQVLANGRPDVYPAAVGTSVAGEHWFRDAMMTASGDDFVVADIGRNPQLGNHLVATYAAGIRENGDAHGALIGALGIFFDWETQSQTVVDGVRLDAEEKARTRCLLLDRHHRVIASSDKIGVLDDQIPLHTSSGAYGNFVDEKGRMVGYALTPGYETYRGLGWYGVLVQEKAKV